MADNTFVVDPQNLFGELQKNWGWMLALGILFVILGTVGLGMTFTLTIASVLFFGILMLIGGVAQLFEAFKSKGWKGILAHILIALLYIAAGILMINRPLLASSVFTLIIAWSLIAVGILRLIMAFQMRGSSGWLWALLAGIITVVLGGMIIAEWPASGVWVIGLFIAIEMIIHGWTYVAVALAARRSLNVST